MEVVSEVDGMIKVESRQMQDLKLSGNGGELDAWVNIDSDAGDSCASSDWDSPGSSPPGSPRAPAPNQASAASMPTASEGETPAIESKPSTPEAHLEVVKPPEAAKPAAPATKLVTTADANRQAPAAAKPAPKPDFDLSKDYYRAELDSVQELAKDRTFKVTLKIVSANAKPLQMFIGDSEGKALVQASSGWKWHQQGCKRPLTYDFMQNVVEKLGRRVDYVRICASERGVFYARVHFVAPAGSTPVLGDTTLAGVDSRPSDALNLALRSGAPVYVHRLLVTEIA